MKHIDLSQVWTLSRFALTSTWRNTTAGRGRKRYSRWMIVWNVVVYLLSGFVLSNIFRFQLYGESFQFAMSILLLYVFLIILSNTLIEFGTGFLAVEELSLLAPFPVSSQTFFVSRIVVLLITTVITSVLLAVGPTTVLILLDVPALAVGSWIGSSFLVAGLTGALGMVVIYSALMRRLRPSQLSKVFNYTQVFATLLTAAGFIIIPRLMEAERGYAYSFHDVPWLQYTPGYLFSHVLGDIRGIEANSLLGMLAIALVPLLAVASYRLLGTLYVSRVEEFSSQTIRTIAQKQSGVQHEASVWLFRSAEARVMWKLFRAQFRHDVKFRMSLLSLLPITAVYFALILINGSVVDPFMDSALNTVLSANMLYLIVLLSPILILQTVSQSEAFKASWLFYACPVDRSELLLGMRTIILLMLFLPYLLILGVAFAFYMPLSHAFMHTTMLALIGLLIFDVYLIVAPRLPFSAPRRQQRTPILSIVWMIFTALIPGALLTVIIHFAYTSSERFWLYAALIATVGLGLHLIVRRRLTHTLEAQEYLA